MTIEPQQARQYFDIRLTGQRLNGKAEQTLRCPFHDDRHGSLSINREKGVWMCQAGCGGGGILDFEERFSHCDRDNARKNINELLGAVVFGGNGKKPIAIYRYTDTHNNLIFEKLRYEPKQFAQRRINGKGAWIWNLDGISEKPLYCLPELVACSDVAIVEGEKDADNLAAAFKTAGIKGAVTTNFEGAGPGKWSPSYSPYFAGKDVVILPDHDDAGRARAEEIAASIHPYAAGIKVVMLPDLPEKGDVSNYLESHSVQQLIAEIGKQKRAWSPSPASSKIQQETTSAVVRADMPETVLDGRLGEICQLHLRQFPLAYSWGALTTTAGILIPRGAGPLRTNLYWCPVGPKGSGKSKSVETVFRLLDMWPSHPLLLKAKYGSAEGLIEKLADIEPGGVRLVDVDELAHLLAKAAIDRSSFPFILNSAYYEDVQTGGSKGRPFQLDCRISLSGGLVEDSFGDAFGMATTGGLYDRFIFGLCPEPYQHLYRPFEGPTQTLNPFPALVDPEVWDVRDQWVKDGIATRVAEHALRVAYICASVDGRPTLRATELGPALAFAQYQTRVRLVLVPNPGENPDARCACDVRNWLAANAPDGKWIKRRHLDRGIHSSRLGPGVFNRCLQNLQFNDEIELDLKLGTLRLR